MVRSIVLPGVDIVVVRMRRLIARALAIAIFVSTLGRVKLAPAGPAASDGAGPRPPISAVAGEAPRPKRPS